MERPVSFEAMAKPPTTEDDDLLPTYWSWKSMPTPFTKDEMIFSYALHPDGRTIFMSTASAQYTMSEVRRHASKESAWIVVHGHVYDCTAFLKDHPGGADSILINAGSDCTEEFDAIHSDKAKALLDTYRIGELINATGGSPAPSLSLPRPPPAAGDVAHGAPPPPPHQDGTLAPRHMAHGAPPPPPRQDGVLAPRCAVPRRDPPRRVPAHEERSCQEIPRPQGNAPPLLAPLC